MKIRFLTEELGFESDHDCVQFLIDHQAQDLVHQVDEILVFSSGKAGLLFDAAKNAAFSRVDIKGQM